MTLVRRDNGEKRQVTVTGVAGEVPGLLDTIQADLLAGATKDRDDRTADVTSIEDVARPRRTASSASRGTASASRASPAWPTTPSPFAASSGPTAASPKPTTSPTSSPSSPAPTDPDRPFWNLSFVVGREFQVPER